APLPALLQWTAVVRSKGYAEGSHELAPLVRRSRLEPPPPNRCLLCRRSAGNLHASNVLGHPAYALGRSRLQNTRTIPGDVTATHPQSAPPPEDAAELPVRSRPGRLRQTVPGTLPRRRGRVPPVRGGGSAATGLGHGHHAGRQYARRRNLHPPGS